MSENDVELIEFVQVVSQDLMCNDEIICSEPKQIQTPLNSAKDFFKRRQPPLPYSNERCTAVKEKNEISNIIAAKRLITEEEKHKMIDLQKFQMVELHEVRMKNEKLKTTLLETLINKIKSCDGEQTLKVLSSNINDK